MKKIFTLMAAAFLTVAAFAADRKPVVSLQANKKYEVIIDGQSYFSNSNRNSMNLSGIRSGQHSIKVYEINKSPFRKIKKLVSASSFQLKRSDIDISVSSAGQISIFEDRFGQKDSGWGRNDDRGYDSRGQDNRNDKNDRDKRF